MATNNDKKDTEVTKPKSAAAKKAKPAAKTAAAQPATRKLTDAVVKGLIGHTDVVYYDCETDMWNRGKYNTYTVNDHEDTEIHQAFKVAMENIPEFSNQYEFAASVTMTISRASYEGEAKLVSKPRYCGKGTVSVGNIIVKNKSTGIYELYGKSWVGVTDYCTGYSDIPRCSPLVFACRLASICGACDFAWCCANNPHFRAALIEAHTR